MYPPTNKPTPTPLDDLLKRKAIADKSKKIDRSVIYGQWLEQHFDLVHALLSGTPERAVEIAARAINDDRVRIFVDHPGLSVAHFAGKYRIDTPHESLTDWYATANEAIDAYIRARNERG